MGSRIMINFAANQEKKENKKTGKREAEKKERKQSTNLREAAEYPSGVAQRAAWQKKMVGIKKVFGVTWTLRKANSHFDPAQNGVWWTAPIR